MHYKLDSVLVLLWPWLCNVDQSLEQHSAVSYHVKIEFPPEDNIDKLPSLTVRPTRPTWWRSLQTSASPLPVCTACWGHWPREIPEFPSLHTGSEWILYLSDPTDQLSIFYRRETYVLSATLKYLERLILAMNGAIRNQREVGRSFCMRMWGWWAGDGQVKWVAGWKIWASNMRAKPSCE